MPDSCITPVYLCITPYSCFVKHTVFFLLSKYLDYNRLVCNLPKHPGVGAMNIRMSRAATSGCMKPEDGRVPVHFRLLFTFFLLVFCKNVPYVGVITSARRITAPLPLRSGCPVLTTFWQKLESGWRDAFYRFSYAVSPLNPRK